MELRAQFAAQQTTQAENPAAEQKKRRRLGKIFRALRQGIAGIGEHIDGWVSRDSAPSYHLRRSSSDRCPPGE